MMKKFLINIVTISLLLLSLSLNAVAHSGRTDSKGGHNKTSDGTYHYHDGSNRTIEYSSPPNKTTTTTTTPPSTTPITPPKPTLPQIGDPIGDVLYSDITAYINGHAIPTSVIQGKTLVVVEDLAKYSFDVVWNGTEKSLKVERNKNKQIMPLTVSKDNKPVGTFKCKHLLTDIKTYLSNGVVESYAIDGVTLIDFELLAKYGSLSWNEDTRSLSLWLE